MKLYNKTKYPDELLKPLLIEAGKAVNARTTNVIVIVTQGKSGVAHQASAVYKWVLDKKRETKTGEYKQRLVYTDGGYFKIRIPYPISSKQWLKSWDLIGIVENIYSVACHEWQHIKQYQTNKYRFHDINERKKRHDNRIWEKDAIKATHKATNKINNKIQDLILDIALWIEAQNK